jgi:DNA-binding NtrC family response regulator
MSNLIDKILERFPFLDFFTTSSYMMLLVDSTGRVTYCHRPLLHKRVLFSHQISGQQIQAFFKMPEDKLIPEILAAFVSEETRLDHFSESVLLSFQGKKTLDYATFPSTPLANELILPPQAHSLLSHCSLTLFTVDPDNFLGIVSFRDFFPPLPLHRPELLLVADLEDRLLTYNHAVTKLLHAENGTSFLGMPLGSLLKISPSQAPELKPQILKPMALSFRPGDCAEKDSLRISPGPPISLENLSSETDVYLPFAPSVDHDHCDYTISLSVRSQTGSYPCLLLRAWDLVPSDTHGYLFGPDRQNREFVLKIRGIEVAKTPFPLPEKNTLTYSVEKIGTRLSFCCNGTVVFSHEESYDFPDINNPHPAILLRTKTACEILDMNLAVSQLYEKPPSYSTGVFQDRPDQTFKVYKIPCDFHNRALYAYHFENTTPFVREIRELRTALESRDKIKDFAGEHPRIRAIKDTLKTLAPSAGSLLLVGETGTGKEILARLFHEMSPRVGKPYVKLDCNTLPATLIESELFGYEPGAFTGAIRRHPGKFEQAQGGTLFLDEIANLSVETQAKLLGVLEDFRITRLGGTKAIPLSVGVVAASNRNLEELIRSNLFRPDLFYRLNRFKIDVPPLRDHLEDLPVLCRSFIAEANELYGKQVAGFSKEAYDRLHAHPWPGNVRELKNVVFKAVLFVRGKTILPEHLELDPSEKRETAGGGGLPAGIRKRQRVTQSRLETALKESDGYISDAAKRLGVTRATLYNRLKKFGLDLNEFRKDQ